MSFGVSTDAMALTHAGVFKNQSNGEAFRQLSKDNYLQTKTAFSKHTHLTGVDWECQGQSKAGQESLTGSWNISVTRAWGQHGAPAPFWAAAAFVESYLWDWNVGREDGGREVRQKAVAVSSLRSPRLVLILAWGNASVCPNYWRHQFLIKILEAMHHLTPQRSLAPSYAFPAPSPTTR